VTGWLLELISAQPYPAWHWSVAFWGTFLLLLPATAAMGATLPAMERVLARMRRQGASIAALYAGNTLGAVLGVLAVAFWLVPEFGLVRTASLCAVLNLVCAAMAMKLFADTANDAAATARRMRPGCCCCWRPPACWESATRFSFVRVVSQVTENTVYTFAILLAVYLVGTALGAAAYGRWSSNANSSERLRDQLLRTLAVACLLGVLSLAYAQTIKAGMLQALGTRHDGRARSRSRARDGSLPAAYDGDGRAFSAISAPAHVGPGSALAAGLA